MAGSDSRSPARALHARLAALDERGIDELYGLEPVYEPAGDAAALGAFAEFLCPWCCETIGTAIDLTDGSRSWIEDCAVCCRPMQVSIEVDGGGELRCAVAERLE